MRQIIFSAFVGSLLLISLSMLQKLLVGYPLRPSSFIIPVCFGGVVGLVIGVLFHRLRRRLDELQSEIRNRQDAEKTSAEQQRNYRVLINSLQERLLVVDTHRRVLDVNNAVVTATGLDRGDIIGKHCYTINHGFDSPCGQRGHECPLDQVFASGEYGSCHYDQQTVGDSEEHCHISFSPLVDSEGNVEQVIEIIHDLSEFVMVQKAAREARDRLAIALDAAELGMWDWDIRTDSVIFNNRFAAIVGHSLEELEPNKRTWEKLIHPEDMPHVMEALAAHLDGETPVYEIEHRLRHKNGQWIDVLSKGQIIERDSGDDIPLRACGMYLDISNRRRAEAERALLQAQLHQAQKMGAIGQLAGGVAHDFNNLLTIILAHTEILQTQLESDEFASGFEVIIKTVDQAVGVTRSLLMFSREMPAEKKNIDLQETIKQAARMLEHMLLASIELVVENNLDEPAWINADATRFQQLLMNLTINARDAMPDGGTLRISTEPLLPGEDVSLGKETSAGATFVKLVVSDTGKGIPQKDIPRVFEPFFSTKERGRGTGLGLSIVEGIVKEHGGYIDVQSQPGQGATFTLFLPSGQADLPYFNEEQSVSIAPRGQGEMVLVAEDIGAVRELLVSTLEQAGYRVVSVADGLEAIDTYREKRERIQLLVLDMDLPKLSGLHCLQYARSEGSTMPAIVITGRLDTGLEGQLDEHSSFLMKPFELSRLCELASTLLRTHEN